jgi:hypothetical protein
MNSRQDLIKAILRYSNEYTLKKLSTIPDEELVYIKIKAEKNNPALKSAGVQKIIKVSKSGKPARKTVRNKKNYS